MEDFFGVKKCVFRFDSDLVEALKAAAKREHRSLNKFVETLLMKVMYAEPNEDTKAAIEEPRSGKSAGTIDTSSFEAFMKSVNALQHEGKG